MMSGITVLKPVAVASTPVAGAVRRRPVVRPFTVADALVS